MRKATEKAGISANAAKSSADTARDTLAVSNRPWLDIDIAIAGPLVLDDLGAHLKVLITTSNVGHSPAVRVTSQSEFIQDLLWIPDPRQELKKICQEAGGVSALNSNRGLTQTVFPGRPLQELWGLILSPAEMGRKVYPGEHSPYIYPVIYWCAGYRADFSEVPHHIGYAWELHRIDQTVPGGIGLIDPRKGNLPINKLLISKVPFVGPYAD